MKNNIALIISFFVSSIILLQGCGGGGGDSPPTTDVTLLNGIWNGVVKSNNAPESTAFGIIYNGDMIFKSREANVIDFGAYTVTGNSFKALLTGYLGSGELSGDTSIIDGTYIPKSSLNGTYVNTSADSGTITFTYDDLYDRGSSTGLLEGIWARPDFVGS